MVAMVLKARMRLQSGLELRFCQRLKEEEKNSPEALLGLAMMVERPKLVGRGWGVTDTDGVVVAGLVGECPVLGDLIDGV